MSPSSETLQRDPVCGMLIELLSVAATVETNGKTYYFCSPTCKEKFDQDPKQFKNSDAPAGGCGD